ncbi:signal peptidase II [Frondihabitans sp. VKM Ac-2883]|uniref:signal peptidase II n=1 Tax=Frondihabitans sp. VKM Ac-2883 TaxID=2783823 RepID=UPI001E482F5A|nr:signal peptidase II [Frondihabitans sp. VKM Ac-2883]
MAPTNTTATKASARILLALAFVAVTVYVLDQGTKFLVVSNLTLGQDVDVLGPVLRFHFVKNPGAAFSLATGSTWIFSIAAAAVVVAIVVFSSRIRSLRWALMLGMLLGGTLGNLTDRLFREPGFGVGHVVDFIYLPWILPAIFNIADTFIVTSMGLLILLTLLGVGLDGKRAPRKGEEPNTIDNDGSDAKDPAAVSSTTDPSATPSAATGRDAS